mmetsp:Transcript_28452/g.88237  ORF Transcript_28452/g.88237 Transcript_28452/m.88237 type:complete len:87 (-) Transcript_28452:99-359(-)
MMRSSPMRRSSSIPANSCLARRAPLILAAIIVSAGIYNLSNLRTSVSDYLAHGESERDALKPIAGSRRAKIHDAFVQMDAGGRADD